jgi:PAS domain S-box-containing protein
MKDEDKTKEQLIDEIVELRREAAESTRMRFAAGQGLKIGDILIDMGLLTRSQLEESLEKQKADSVDHTPNHRPLGEILTESGVITAEQLYTALVEQLTMVRALEAERNKAKEELREAQKYAQGIINSSLDMIIAADNDRRIIEFNEAAERAFGYSREEVLGKHVGILYGDSEKEGLEVNESTKKMGRFTGEITNKRKNGESFPSLISASILHNTKGDPIGFMGISRDITEQKQIEERLRQSEKMASLGRLVAGATHELNNPMSFIYSNVCHLRRYIQDIKMVFSRYDHICTYLADRVSDIERIKKQIDLDYTMSDLDRLVDDVHEGARRTKGIVEDLKAFSNSKNGKIVDMDINEDLERSLKLLLDYHRDRITIHRDYADLPRVKCYAGQIGQVFMNLLANACQAIEGQGDIWIATRLEGHTVIISIRDNGVGIDKEHVDKIFDPFFTTRDVGEGTGLGLSISYGIIERHKGKILVDSQLGSGTTFTIRMPANFEDRECI